VVSVAEMVEGTAGQSSVAEADCIVGSGCGFKGMVTRCWLLPERLSTCVNFVQERALPVAN